MLGNYRQAECKTLRVEKQWFLPAWQHCKVEKLLLYLFMDNYKYQSSVYNANFLTIKLTFRRQIEQQLITTTTTTTTTSTISSLFPALKWE